MLYCLGLQGRRDCPEIHYRVPCSIILCYCPAVPNSIKNRYFTLSIQQYRGTQKYSTLNSLSFPRCCTSSFDSICIQVYKVKVAYTNGQSTEKLGRYIRMQKGIEFHHIRAQSLKETSL